MITKVAFRMIVSDSDVKIEVRIGVGSETHDESMNVWKMKNMIWGLRTLI